MSGAALGSGVACLELFSCSFCAGVPSQGATGANPGGIDGERTGLDGSNSWRKAAAGCACGRGRPGGSVGVPERIDDARESSARCGRNGKPKLSTDGLSLADTSSGGNSSSTVGSS